MIFLVIIWTYCGIGFFLVMAFLDKILEALPRPEWSLGVDYEMRIFVLWPIYILRTIVFYKRKAKELK